MRIWTGALAVATLLGAAPALGAQAQPEGFAREFLGQFNSSMEKFVALAEAMPADRYGWSPGPGVMSVARVYAHVARYNYLYPATSLGVPAPAGRDGDDTEDVAGKAEVVRLLRESAAHVRQVVAGLPPTPAAPTRLYGRDVPQWAVLFQLLAHMNEHFGQSVAYARMNGVVPPWSR
jgi:uncharacterized damage-inducible protein DinB